MPRTTPVLAAAMLAAAVVPAAVVTGCAGTGGPQVSSTRALPEVRAIDAGGDLHVVVRRGPRPALQIDGHRDDVERVRVEVDGSVLRLTGDEHRGIGLRVGRARATVTLPALRAVEASGAVDLDLPGLAGDEVELRAGGGADVSGAGRVRRLLADVSGGGDVDLRDVSARDVRLDVSGGGDAWVTALRRLDVDVSGGGDASYRGDPVVRRRVSGGGDLTHE